MKFEENTKTRNFSRIVNGKIRFKCSIKCEMEHTRLTKQSNFDTIKPAFAVEHACTQFDIVFGREQAAVESDDNDAARINAKAAL